MTVSSRFGILKTCSQVTAVLAGSTTLLSLIVVKTAIAVSAATNSIVWGVGAMNFETKFWNRKWLMTHGPIRWIAHVAERRMEKQMLKRDGFGRFGENDPTQEEIKEHRDAKAKAEYGNFKPLTQAQHEALSAAQPKERGKLVETLLPDNLGEKS